MSFRVPIGIRIYRSTHVRLRRMALELNVPIGAVVDQAVASLPPIQAEIPIGLPLKRQWVRSHVRRSQRMRRSR